MKEKYEKLVERYSLPEYSELGRYFAIEGIDDDDNILKEIIKKIHLKVESYASMIESLIQPDSTLGSMHEASYLDEDKKKNLIKLFAKLMSLERTLVLENLEFEEETAAKTIKASVAEWKELLPELKSLLKNMKDSWNKETIVKEERGYFG